MCSPEKKRRRKEAPLPLGSMNDLLPLEIVAIILEYVVEPKDRAAVKRTCKTWQVLLNNIIARDKALHCVVCNSCSELPSDRAYVSLKNYAPGQFRFLAYRLDSPYTLSTIFRCRNTTAERWCFCTVHNGACYEKLSNAVITSADMENQRLVCSHVNLAYNLLQLQKDYATRLPFYTPIVPKSVFHRIAAADRVNDDVRCLGCLQWLYSSDATQYVYCNLQLFEKGWILPIALLKLGVPQDLFFEHSMVPLRLLGHDKYYTIPEELGLRGIAMFYCRNCNTAPALQTSRSYYKILNALEQLRNLKLTAIANNERFRPLQALEKIACEFPDAADFLVPFFGVNTLPKK